jgi:hypothetical protein
VPPPNFHALTIKSNGIADRLITDIHVFPGFDPKNPPKPLPSSIATKALWDTGATKSVISTDVAMRLGLTPVGTTNVNHAGGLGTSSTYLVNFGLPQKVMVAGALVTEFPTLGGGFGAIVGMDVICLGDLSISNVSGRTCMSFRIPSCEIIDYVAEWNRTRFAGTPRNAPCPCGKKGPGGKVLKYKHCHGQ